MYVNEREREERAREGGGVRFTECGHDKNPFVEVGIGYEPSVKGCF